MGIMKCKFSFGGREYFSVPDLVVFDPTGAGTGAKLRAVIVNEKINDVKILNRRNRIFNVKYN